MPNMVNYVKFLKGTPSAFGALEHKDSNTLYFIIAEGAKFGKLYLGDILVAGNVTPEGDSVVDSLAELIDVNLLGLQSGQVLGYNGTEWVPMTLPEAVEAPIMTGATADLAGTAGLVPAPQAGDHNKFLRGDGKWVEVSGGDIDLTDYAKTETVNAIDTRVTTLEGEQDNLERAITWGTL